MASCCTGAQHSAVCPGRVPIRDKSSAQRASKPAERGAGAKQSLQVQVWLLKLHGMIRLVACWQRHGRACWKQLGQPCDFLRRRLPATMQFDRPVSRTPHVAAHLLCCLWR